MPGVKFAADCMKPITYPARPINGGPFGLVSRKAVQLWSPKLNGWRALLHAPTRSIFNRHGEELSIAGEFTEALEHLSRSSVEWLDCEALERRHDIGRGCLIILDAVVPDLTATDRYRLLAKEAHRLGWPGLGIANRPQANQACLMEQTALSDATSSGRQILMHWWTWMQRLNGEWGADFYEGLVAKRTDSLYPIQLRSPEAESPFWIKHRWAW
jgi:hypothetical protein